MLFEHACACFFFKGFSKLHCNLILCHECFPNVFLTLKKNSRLFLLSFCLHANLIPLGSLVSLFELEYLMLSKPGSE